MNRIPVLISSKMDELVEDRQCVAEAVSRTDTLEPVFAENWAPKRGNPYQESALEALRCPIYLGLFWRVYSPATVIEYNAAISNTATEILLYIREAPESERDLPLRELIGKFRDDHICKYYAVPADLTKVVRKHLRAAIVRMIERLHNSGTPTRAFDSPRARAAQLKILAAWNLSLDPNEALALLNQSAAGLEDADQPTV